MRSKNILASLSFVSLLSVAACAVDPTEGEGEVTADTEQALANTGGGGGLGWTAKSCTDCGCTVVYTGRDANDCRVYECHCPSTSSAECVSPSNVASVKVRPRPVKVPISGGLGFAR
jgi:hypothetical protein